MLTVACVLRSGGEYKPAHVVRLRDGVRAHLRMKHRFLCLTDLYVPCEMVPLRNNCSACWAKIEPFHRDMPRPVLYFDLDTIIVDQLDGLALEHRFTVLQNFWAADRIGSGMMAWDCDLSSIYDAYAR